MTDYQISLPSSGGATVSSLDARCADAWEALGLAQRMHACRGHSDAWTGARRVGQVSEATGAEVEAVGQPWALQPVKRA